MATDVLIPLQNNHRCAAFCDGESDALAGKDASCDNACYRAGYLTVVCGYHQGRVWSHMADPKEPARWHYLNPQE